MIIRNARTRYRKLRRRYDYLQWLASSHGPRESPYLRRFAPPALLLGALRLQHAFAPGGARCHDTNGFFIPPTPAVKARAIRRYARTFGLTTFVETGTYLGDTVAAVLDQFASCLTIELSEDLHDRARARFASSPQVTCLRGDSGALLAGVIPMLDGPTLFWLDAHDSGAGTASAGYDPIGRELRAIYANLDRRHVILIDDASGHAVDAIAAAVPATHAVAVRNNIIRITPAGG
jgi:hypothetical protein